MAKKKTPSPAKPKIKADRTSFDFGANVRRGRGSKGRKGGGS